MPGNGDICYQISTHRSLRNKARSGPGDPLAVFPAHFFLHGPHFLCAGNRVRGIVWMKQMRKTNFINRRWVYPTSRKAGL